MNVGSRSSRVAKIVDCVAHAVRERYQLDVHLLNWSSSLYFMAAGLWGYALVGASAYFLLLNQLALREREYFTSYVSTWVGGTEHAGNVFYAVLGLPPCAVASRLVDVGFVEVFGKMQTPLVSIEIVRLALYLTASLAFLRALLPKHALATNATRLSRCGIATVLLTVATTWFTSRQLPAGANAHGVLGSMYTACVLSCCTLGISAFVIGKDSSNRLTGPRLLVAVSAFASAYLILKCSTKLYVNFPFEGAELLARTDAIRNAIALWGAAGAVISNFTRARDTKPRSVDLGGLLACAVAIVFFVGVRPLAWDARLVVGRRPNLDRVSSFRNCEPLPPDAMPVELEAIRRSSNDQLHFMKGHGLALHVSLDAQLAEHGIALCRLCGWNRDLHVVAERTTLVHSRTVGSIPVFANTCSPGTLKLDCKQGGGSQVTRRTFRSLMSDTPPTSVPMRDICYPGHQDH